VVYYWIASALLGVVLNFTVGTVAPRTALTFGNLLQFVLVLPMFALFVRRLHDQGKSGWWGLLLPLSLLLGIPRVVTEVRGDVVEIIVERSTPISLAADLCALAAFVLCLWRGTDGTNRYGPDPRLEEG
jgi:uncharacterized membrane protein YhaH (DUF805 family)